MFFFISVKGQKIFEVLIKVDPLEGKGVRVVPTWSGQALHVKSRRIYITSLY